MDQVDWQQIADYKKRIFKDKPSAEETERIMAMAAAGLKALGPAAYEQPDNDSSGNDLGSPYWLAVDLVDALSYANAASYKELVASFLHGKNAHAAYMALGILGYFYGVTGEYANQIAELIRGAHWDPFSTAQEKAVAVAANYLEEHEEPTCFAHLLKLPRTGPKERSQSLVPMRAILRMNRGTTPMVR